MNWAAAVAAAALAVATACSSSASTSTPSTGAGKPSGGTEADVNADDLAYPLLGSTREAAEQDRLVAKAEERLIKRCMEGRGFAYVVMDLPSASPGSSSSRGSQYSLMRVDEAQRQDFSSEEVALPETDNDKLLKSMTADAQAAWTEAMLGTEANKVEVPLENGKKLGYHTDGCISQARLTLFPDRPAFLQAEKRLAALAGQVIGAVTASEEYKVAVGRWHTCLRESGHDHADPGAAMAALTGSKPPLSLQARRALAVASARCQESAGLWSVAAKLQSREVQRVRTENESVFIAFIEGKRAAVDRASSALQGS